MKTENIDTFDLCITVTFPVFLPFIKGDNHEDLARVTMPVELYERLEYAKALFHEVQREVRKHVEAQDRRRWDTYDRNVPREMNLDDLDDLKFKEKFL